MSGPTIAPTGFWRAEGVRKHHMTSQPLAEWIAVYLRGQEATPVYDFGCGIGAYLALLRSRGFVNTTGFEGDPPHDGQHAAVQHDLTEPFTVPIPGNVLCLEVGEHVPATYEDVLLDTITRAVRGTLILSWAVRGQGGDGHVNCLDNVEVIGRVCSRGLRYLAGRSVGARACADLPWFKNTLMVFER